MYYALFGLFKIGDIIIIKGKITKFMIKKFRNGQFKNRKFLASLMSLY